MEKSDKEIQLEVDHMWNTYHMEWLFYIYRAEDEEELARAVEQMERTWEEYSRPWWVDQ